MVRVVEPALFREVWWATRVRRRHVLERAVCLLSVSALVVIARLYWYQRVTERVTHPTGFDCCLSAAAEIVYDAAVAACQCC